MSKLSENSWISIGAAASIFMTSAYCVWWAAGIDRDVKASTEINSEQEKTIATLSQNQARIITLLELTKRSCK